MKNLDREIDYCEQVLLWVDEDEKAFNRMRADIRKMFKLPKTMSVISGLKEKLSRHRKFKETLEKWEEFCEDNATEINSNN